MGHHVRQSTEPFDFYDDFVAWFEPRPRLLITSTSFTHLVSRRENIHSQAVRSTITGKEFLSHRTSWSPDF